MGRLEPHFDSEGASFVPDEPFEPGEEVKVSTDLTIPGGSDGDYRFWVSRPGRAAAPAGRGAPGRAGHALQDRPDLMTRDRIPTKPQANPRRHVHRPQARLGHRRADDPRQPGEVVWARAADDGDEVSTSASRATAASPC